MFSCSIVSNSATPRTVARQASLSFTISWSLLKLMSIESMMPSNHLILCCPHLLLSSFFPSIQFFSNELALHIRWLKYWSFSFSISPSNDTSFKIFNVGKVVVLFILLVKNINSISISYLKLSTNHLKNIDARLSPTFKLKYGQINPHWGKKKSLQSRHNKDVTLSI